VWEEKDSDGFIDILYENPGNRAFIGCGKLPLKTRQIIQNWGYTGKF
jgi:hypothetical protein